MLWIIVIKYSFDSNFFILLTKNDTHWQWSDEKIQGTRRRARQEVEVSIKIARIVCCHRLKWDLHSGQRTDIPDV